MAPAASLQRIQCPLGRQVTTAMPSLAGIHALGAFPPKYQDSWFLWPAGILPAQCGS